MTSGAGWGSKVEPRGRAGDAGFLSQAGGRTSLGAKWGKACRICSAAPATKGAAIDVPESTAADETPSATGYAAVISEPGAKRVVHEP